MKNFLIGFVLSTFLMFGMVYVTAIQPNLMTSLFEVPDEPIDIIIETPPDTSNNPTYLDHIEKGSTLFDNHFYPLAITEFEMATELEPTLSEPFYKLGNAYYSNYEYEKARLVLETANTNNPANLNATVLLGKTYLALEQFETAKEHFDTAPAESTEVLYYRALLNSFIGDYDNAEIDFNKVINAGDFPELAQNAQTFISSIDESKLAEDGNPNYLKTLTARSYSESGESNLAINLLYDILREEPSYRDAWIILGYTYLSLESYRDSQDALQKALELDPTKPETRYFLGLAYFGSDEYSSAVTQIELAIESDYEPRVQAYQKLADTAVLAAEYEKAVEAYENVLIINSADVNLYIRPVWLYLDKLNNLDRAIELGEQAVTEHPDSAMSYNLLGWALTTSGDYANADHHLNYALILDSNLSAAYLNLGWLAQKQNNLEAAKEHYKRCYTLDPDSSVGNLAANRYNEILAQEEAAASELNPPA
jgi:tetratricopeptide (TPR) repeat protein